MTNNKQRLYKYVYGEAMPLRRKYICFSVAQFSHLKTRNNHGFFVRNR